MLNSVLPIQRRLLVNAYTLSAVGITLAGLLVGCQPKSDAPAKIEPASINTSNLPDLPPKQTATSATSLGQIERGTASLPAEQAEIAGQEIAQRLEVSYARASANTSNECPKLVEFQFSNQSITRQDERFPQQTCDYFVYLRQGEILKIDVSNQVKAELVSPVNFDFANGSYTAPKYDKYTIRLSYDGTRFHPQNFKYDVILTKAKSEATF